MTAGRRGYKAQILALFSEKSDLSAQDVADLTGCCLITAYKLLRELSKGTPKKLRVSGHRKNPRGLHATLFSLAHGAKDASLQKKTKRKKQVKKTAPPAPEKKTAEVIVLPPKKSLGMFGI